MLILPLAETLFPFNKYSPKGQNKLDELTKLYFSVSVRLLCVEDDFTDKKSPSDLSWCLVRYFLKGVYYYGEQSVTVTHSPMAPGG